jgi:hypothetical protein
MCVSIAYQKETKSWETPEPEERYFLPFGIHTYIHTKLYLNHASLSSRWKAGFHEGREITYLQKVNYIQEIQNITK